MNSEPKFVPLEFSSVNANDLCGNCGHELDKHAIWHASKDYDGPITETCCWSADNGNCECVDFVFAPPGIERNLKAWKSVSIQHALYYERERERERCACVAEYANPLPLSNWGTELFGFDRAKKQIADRIRSGE